MLQMINVYSLLYLNIITKTQNTIPEQSKSELWLALLTFTAFNLVSINFAARRAKNFGGDGRIYPSNF